MQILWEERVNVAVRQSVEPLVPVFEVLTHLGDGSVLLVAAILFYWFGSPSSRRDRAFVIAVGTVALALSAGIKGIFGLPRPTLVFSPIAYPGYTFPSAHAMGSAAVYGALAMTMQLGRQHVRIVIAAAIVALVSISRVVLGVHYAGDVIVGALLGAVIVWVGLRRRDVGKGRPHRMFVLAGLVAIATPILGSRVFVALTIGVALGGLLGWHLVVDRPTTDRGAAILVVGVGGILGIFLVRTIVALVEAPWRGTVTLFVLEVAAYAVLTAFVLVVPRLALAVEDHPVTLRLQHTLPFRGRRFAALGR